MQPGFILTAKIRSGYESLIVRLSETELYMINPVAIFFDLISKRGFCHKYFCNTQTFLLEISIYFVLLTIGRLCSSFLNPMNVSHFSRAKRCAYRCASHIVLY
jgi:hypothetical protein